MQKGRMHRTPDKPENNWKENLTLLHRRTPQHQQTTHTPTHAQTPEKENSRNGFQTSSNSKSQRKRDKELAGLALADPAAALFTAGGVMSTPTHSLSVSGVRTNSSREEDGVEEGWVEPGQALWDTSLFRPSPSPLKGSSRGPAGGGGSIIDIDFRHSHPHRPHGYQGGEGSMCGDHDDSEDVLCMEGVEDTPTRRKVEGRQRHGDSYCIGDDSYSYSYEESSSSSADITNESQTPSREYSSGHDQSEMEEEDGMGPEESSFRVDEGRDLLFNPEGGQRDEQSMLSLEGTKEQSEPLRRDEGWVKAGGQVNQVLNFGASVDGHPISGSDGVTERTSAQYGSDSFVSARSESEITALDDVCSDHRGVQEQQQQVCRTPEKHSHCEEDSLPPRSKSDISPEAAALRQGEQAGELRSLVKGGGSGSGSGSGRSRGKSEAVSPTTDKAHSDFARRLFSAEDDQAPQQQQQQEQEPQQTPQSSEHIMATPSTKQPHVKPALEPESPFVAGITPISRASGINASRTTSQAAGSGTISGAGVGGDEWKTATTPQGKTYFYNRRTRESAWKLPVNAIYLRSGESSYRIFVPPPSATADNTSAATTTASATATATSTSSQGGQSSSSQSGHSSSSRSGRGKVSEFSTPPRSKTRSEGGDASGRSEGSVRSSRPAHYSPTRGLMSTPKRRDKPADDCAHIKSTPTTASPGVAYRSRRGGSGSNNQEETPEAHSHIPRIRAESLPDEGGSYDMLEHGVVLPRSESRSQQASQQTPTREKVQLFCPLCGDGLHLQAGGFEEESELRRHLLQCASSEEKRARASRLVALLSRSLPPPAEQPLPSTSVTIEKGSPGATGQVSHHPSPRPEVSFSSQGSVITSPPPSGQKQIRGYSVLGDPDGDMQTNRDSGPEIVAGTKDAYLRHHPRSVLQLGSRGGERPRPPSPATYSELFRARSAQPATTTATTTTPPTATPLSYSSPGREERGLLLTTPSSIKATQPPALSCDKAPRETMSEGKRQTESAVDRTEGRGLFVCPCCQTSEGLDSRELLLRHMRACVDYTDTSPPTTTTTTPTPATATATADSTFSGHGHAKAVCPFCGRPSSKSALSSHLLGCQKRKASQERRTHPTKPLASQSHKDRLPAFTSPPPSKTKGGSRRRIPLGDHSNKNTLNQLDDRSTASGWSGSAGGASVSSAALSQASTVALQQKRQQFSSPMSRRVLGAPRQQEQKQQGRHSHSNSRISSHTPSPLKPRRTVIAAFR